MANRYYKSTKRDHVDDKLGKPSPKLEEALRLELGEHGTVGQLKANLFANQCLCISQMNRLPSEEKGNLPK